MVKCTKKEIRRLKTALRWKGHPQQRQRIQMVLLRENGMTQPAIAESMGVSRSTVNRVRFIPNATSRLKTPLKKGSPMLSGKPGGLPPGVAVACASCSPMKRASVG